MQIFYSQYISLKGKWKWWWLVASDWKLVTCYSLLAACQESFRQVAYRLENNSKCKM